MLGHQARIATDELKDLIVLLDAASITADIKFVAKAADYMNVWAHTYEPDRLEVDYFIGLDQRLFGDIYARLLLSPVRFPDEFYTNAVKLARTVNDAEVSFQKMHHPFHINNKFACSNYTGVMTYAFLQIQSTLPSENNLSKFLVGNEKDDIRGFFYHVRKNVSKEGLVFDYYYRDSAHYQVFNQLYWEKTRLVLNQLGIDVPKDVVDRLNMSLTASMRFVNGTSEHVEFLHPDLHYDDPDHIRQPGLGDEVINAKMVGRAFNRNSYTCRELSKVTSYLKGKPN